jgi:hypothetical protein
MPSLPKNIDGTAASNVVHGVGKELSGFKKLSISHLAWAAN